MFVSVVGFTMWNTIKMVVVLAALFFIHVIGVSDIVVS